MTPVSNVRLIELVWDGPFSQEKVHSFSSKSDYGLYQIYGTHQIFGTDSLLYIGKASEQVFAQRVVQHSDWLMHEQSKASFYLGRFGNDIGKTSDDDWRLEINTAEKLLIYHCSPPYNSQHINSVDLDPEMNVVVFNFGLRHKLPFQISTLASKSHFSNRIWQPYS